VAIAQTDDTGAYRASGLAPDVYIVSTVPGVLRELNANGQAFESTFGSRRGPLIFYPGVDSVEGAQRIAVQGDEKAGVSFVVPAQTMGGPTVEDVQGGPPPERTPATVVLRGRIFAPSGLPLPGARVMVFDVENQAPRLRNVTQSGEDGSY